MILTRIRWIWYALLIVVSLPSVDSQTSNTRFGPLDRMFAINYGPYRESQSPGQLEPSFSDIQADLPIIASQVDTLRLYSCQGIHEQIVEQAQAYQLQVVVQAWISADLENNEREMQACVDLSNRFPNVVGVLVGSEVILRGEQTSTELIAYIQRMRDQVGVPVGYADVSAVWNQNPGLVAAVDWVGLHSYGFWNCVTVDQAATFTINEWKALKSRPEAQNKRVIIFETGWPSNHHNPDCPSTTQGSEGDQQQFTAELLGLVGQNNVDLFLFELTDEPWKCVASGIPVECFWGLLDKDRNPKGAWHTFLSDAMFLDQLLQDTWTYLSSDWATSNHLPWSWRSDCPNLSTGGAYANTTEIGLLALTYLSAFELNRTWSPAWSTVETELNAILDQLLT